MVLPEEKDSKTNGQIPKQDFGFFPNELQNLVNGVANLAELQFVINQMTQVNKEQRQSNNQQK